MHQRALPSPPSCSLLPAADGLHALQEMLHVQSRGGVVLNRCGSGVARVMGVLAVSRALGNVTLKPYITSEPGENSPLPVCRVM